VVLIGIEFCLLIVVALIKLTKIINSSDVNQREPSIILLTLDKNMQQEILYIDNLKCGGCANTIRQALLQFKELNSIDIDVEKGAIKLGSDEEFQRAKYFSVLSKLGYPEVGTSTILQKGRSYISCAIGRVKPN
jgi:copper chaperone CopZ